MRIGREEKLNFWVSVQSWSYRGCCSLLLDHPFPTLDSMLNSSSLPCLFSEVPACIALQMTTESSCDWTEVDLLWDLRAPGRPFYAPQPTSSLVSWPSALREAAWDYLKRPRKAEGDRAQLALVLGACWDTAEVCPALISSTLKGQSGRELLSNYPV